MSPAKVDALLSDSENAKVGPVITSYDLDINILFVDSSVVQYGTSNKYHC